MKRDMELIRQILLRIESWDHWRQSGFEMCGYEQDEVDHNVGLLISRGLIDGHLKRRGSGKPRLIVGQLEWEGHDFLDAIRSESIWEKTKDYLKAKDLQNVPFEVLTKVLVSIISKQAGVD